MYWWWYFPASFMCPHDIQRVGPLSDGGKWICGMSLYEEKPRAKCVIYSFGINYETRFEGEMLQRTDCEIYAYDASVSGVGPGKLLINLFCHVCFKCLFKKNLVSSPIEPPIYLSPL